MVRTCVWNSVLYLSQFRDCACIRPRGLQHGCNAEDVNCLSPAQCLYLSLSLIHKLCTESPRTPSKTTQPLLLSYPKLVQVQQQAVFPFPCLKPSPPVTEMISSTHCNAQNSSFQGIAPAGPILSTADIYKEEQYRQRNMFEVVAPPEGPHHKSILTCKC